MVFLVFCAIFSIILFRLFHLQVLKYDFFKAQAQKNIFKFSYTDPPRGLIFDANNDIIASNQVSFCGVFSVPYSKKRHLMIQKYEEIKSFVEQELSVSRESIQETLNNFTLTVCNLTPIQLERIYRLKLFNPNIEIKKTYNRVVNKPEAFSSIIGYLAQSQSNQSSFAPIRQRGVLGVEKCYDDFLSGVEGITKLSINVRAETVETITLRKETSGLNLKLFIRKDWQNRAFELLSGKAGAIVVLEVNTGYLRTVVSAPSYNANAFNNQDVPEIRKILNNVEKPLINRAFQGVYPPGSVAKIFVALGLANYGKKVKTAFCPGYDLVGKRSLRCHKRSGHGTMDLVEAISQSCDVYFYNLSKLANYDEIFNSLSLFGFGKETGLECIPQSKGTLRPKDKIKHSIEFEKALISIGQGGFSASPIQVAVAMASLLNGGKILKPKLVEEIYSDDSTTYFNFSSPEVMQTIELEKQTMEAVKEGMFKAINSSSGTAYSSRSKQVLYAGKTGTAQVIDLKRKTKQKIHEDHAWFVGYWPVENPKFVIVVIVEHGGSGGQIAAPIAKEFIEFAGG
ncbi:MAG: penicillin-binding transpeptidase domain-containing protein [Deltaproteobacteria bacterium]|nr:penicillin-binding transpeptidase domain-containing protein [Deltaproteobacteria bacterium]